MQPRLARWVIKFIHVFQEGAKVEEAEEAEDDEEEASSAGACLIGNQERKQTKESSSDVLISTKSSWLSAETDEQTDRQQTTNRARCCWVGSNKSNWDSEKLRLRLRLHLARAQIKPDQAR